MRFRYSKDQMPKRARTDADVYNNFFLSVG